MCSSTFFAFPESFWSRTEQTRPDTVIKVQLFTIFIFYPNKINISSLMFECMDCISTYISEKDISWHSIPPFFFKSDQFGIMTILFISLECTKIWIHHVHLILYHGPLFFTSLRTEKSLSKNLTNTSQNEWYLMNITI